MRQPEPVRRRIQSLDGTSFRFERKAHILFVNDLPVQVQVKDQGIVELSTTAKTVQVTGATYWAMVYDEVMPTPLSAGILLAKYDELIGRLQQIAKGRQEKPADNEGDATIEQKEQ